ncbi:uncharacterized protein [Haliotis cracherodii]|uniref:uncharacterized protein n=1 Tax=Haliotis cracherodii TaxID=6455 RepID=UPI0039EBB585
MVLLWLRILCVVACCCVQRCHSDEAWTGSDTSTTSVREGHNATFTWNMRIYGHRFYVRSPTDKSLLTVESSLVSVWPQYISRIKITGVTNSSAGLAVQFILYSVTASDAGRYTCSKVWWSGGSTIPDCGYTLVVEGTAGQASTASSALGQDTTLVYSTPFKSTAPDHHLTLSWTTNNTHLLKGKRTQADQPHSSSVRTISYGCPAILDLFIVTLFVVGVSR